MIQVFLLTQEVSLLYIIMGVLLFWARSYTIPRVYLRGPHSPAGHMCVVAAPSMQLQYFSVQQFPGTVDILALFQWETLRIDVIG